MHTCPSCSRQFLSSQAFHAHCVNNADHTYCEDCQKLFKSTKALHQHLKCSADHANGTNGKDHQLWEEDFEIDDVKFCTICDRWYVDQTRVCEHQSPAWWCFLCSREFRSAHAWENHTSSVAHKNRDLKCPLCDQMFKAPSAIAHHIESGCRGTTRHQVTAAVHSLEVVPSISITRQLPGTTNTLPPIVISTTATELAFNGQAYECYLCHRTFRKLASLNAHLNSAAHDADEFKCPKCRKEFKLVSSLIQHIEQESCGLARFAQVESYARGLVDQFSNLLTL